MLYVWESFVWSLLVKTRNTRFNRGPFISFGADTCGKTQTHTISLKCRHVLQKNLLCNICSHTAKSIIEHIYTDAFSVLIEQHISAGSCHI
jgi:hypothetical protein